MLWRSSGTETDNWVTEPNGLTRRRFQGLNTDPTTESDMSEGPKGLDFRNRALTPIPLFGSFHVPLSGESFYVRCFGNRR